MQRRLLLVVLTACLILPGALYAQKGAKGSKAKKPKPAATSPLGANLVRYHYDPKLGWVNVKGVPVTAGAPAAPPTGSNSKSFCDTSFCYASTSGGWKAFKVPEPPTSPVASVPTSANNPTSGSPSASPSNTKGFCDSQMGWCYQWAGSSWQPSSQSGK